MIMNWTLPYISEIRVGLGIFFPWVSQGTSGRKSIASQLWLVVGDSYSPGTDVLSLMAPSWRLCTDPRGFLHQACVPSSSKPAKAGSIILMVQTSLTWTSASCLLPSTVEHFLLLRSHVNSLEPSRLFRMIYLLKIFNFVHIYKDLFVWNQTYLQVWRCRGWVFRRIIALPPP